MNIKQSFPSIQETELNQKKGRRICRKIVGDPEEISGVSEQALVDAFGYLTADASGHGAAVLDIGLSIPYFLLTH
jgi:hypothetical protein